MKKNVDKFQNVKQRCIAKIYLPTDCTASVHLVLLSSIAFLVNIANLNVSVCVKLCRLIASMDLISQKPNANTPFSCSFSVIAPSGLELTSALLNSLLLRLSLYQILCLA